jgi:hypothetical protein
MLKIELQEGKEGWVYTLSKDGKAIDGGQGRTLHSTLELAYRHSLDLFKENKHARIHHKVHANDARIRDSR